MKKKLRINVTIVPAGETTQMAEDHCPYCGHRIDAATATELNPESLPEPGCLTVCIKCGGICVFGPDLRLSKVTDQELMEIRENDTPFWSYITLLSVQLKQAAIACVTSTQEDDFTRRKQ